MRHGESLKLISRKVDEEKPKEKLEKLREKKIKNDYRPIKIMGKLHNQNQKYIFLPSQLDWKEFLLFINIILQENSFFSMH